MRKTYNITDENVKYLNSKANASEYVNLLISCARVEEHEKRKYSCKCGEFDGFSNENDGILESDGTKHTTKGCGQLR